MSVLLLRFRQAPVSKRHCVMCIVVGDILYETRQQYVYLANIANLDVFFVTVSSS